MCDEEFTFETAPFPPEPLPEGKIFNKTIQTIVNCIVSLPTDPASPFVTLAASLPNPTSSSSSSSSSTNESGLNSNFVSTDFVDPHTGLVSIPALQDNEVEHAREILRLYPAFAEVRRRIVPRLVNDEKFWQAYFCLLSIQTRYERRMEAMFGASGELEDENNEEDDNQQQKHSNADLQAMMSARVVLRMPTPSLHHNVQDNNISKKKNTKMTSSSKDDSPLEPDTPTTRIIPGKRLRIPPSLCITVRDTDSSATVMMSANNNSSKKSGSSGGGDDDHHHHHHTNFSSSSIGGSSTSTMLMGKDMMTKHMRDEWRRNLNEMCDYEY